MNIAIVDRYLARQTLTIILLVSLALLGIDLFFNLVTELKMIGRGNYTLNDALQYLVLTSPTRIYAAFPWAALLGTLIALSMLANHRELVVLRTSAISVYRIAWAIVKGAMMLTFFVLLLGEVVAPHLERIAQNKRTLALSQGQSIQTPYGLWIRSNEDFIHIRYVKPNGELNGVTRYQFDKNRQLKEVIVAASAIKEERGWRLHNIHGTRFEHNKTVVIKKESEWLETLLDPEILETAAVKHPERLSLLSLWRTIQHRSKNDLNTGNYELAFWTKIFQPILILIMVFIAVPFVFGPLRSASMGLRILAGIILAYSFHTLNGMFGPLALHYQVPAFIAILLPLIAFTSVGFGLLRKVK